MKSRILALLGVGIRVDEFVQAHPLDNPGFLVATDQLGARIDDIRVLGRQEAEGDTARKRAVARSDALAREIRAFFLKPIAAIAGMIFRDHPERIEAFRMPSRGTRKKEVFLSRARAIVAAVEAEEADFLRYGMDPGLLAELKQALDEFERLPGEASSGRRTAATARDTLAVAAADLLGIIRQLDGLNRHRFRDQPELLAAWLTAADIPPRRTRRKPADAPDDISATAKEGTNA